MSSIVFSPDGHWLLAGQREGRMMKMWDAATGEQVLSLDHISPSGFARDGRRIAASSHLDAAFLELILPQSVRTLSGHRARVVQSHWSRDSRHLLSIDAQFAVHVWEIEGSRSLGSFLHPADGWHADNAGVALSDDTPQLASAGHVVALIQDVQSRETVADWRLPPGAGNHMVYIGEGKFLLVREDLSKWQTEAYELVAAPAQPKLWRVVRERVRDEWGFLDSRLTPDGRYYLWVGPREPAANRRTEVREVATGRLLTAVKQPGQEKTVERGASLSPRGRFLTVEQVGRHQVFDLIGHDPPLELTERPDQFSPDDRWAVFLVLLAERGDLTGLALRQWPSRKTWMEFVNSDSSAPAWPTENFSPDSRYLAWGSQSGTITVVDIPALEQEVQAFEHSLGAK